MREMKMEAGEFWTFATICLCASFVAIAGNTTTIPFSAHGTSPCYSGYTGTNCTEDIDECLDNHYDICWNRGICTNYPGGYNCTCLQGWLGTHCNQPDENETDRKCMPGYTGAKCDTLTACGHGNGRNISGNLTCLCHSGWTHAHENEPCNRDVNECSKEPTVCKSGSCTNSNGSYICNCTGYWFGRNCNYYNTCAEGNPCLNNGTCMIGENTASFNQNYTCGCPVSWYGLNCSYYNACANSNPCQNGGTCMMIENITHPHRNYSCQCPKHWYGPNCSYYNACTGYSPCKNGAVCVTRGNDQQLQSEYNCQCKPGWHGKNCTKFNDTKTTQMTDGKVSHITTPLGQHNTNLTSPPRSLTSVIITTSYTRSSIPDTELTLSSPGHFIPASNLTLSSGHLEPTPIITSSSDSSLEVTKSSKLQGTSTPIIDVSVRSSATATNALLLSESSATATNIASLPRSSTPVTDVSLGSIATATDAPSQSGTSATVTNASSLPLSSMPTIYVSLGSPASSKPFSPLSRSSPPVTNVSSLTVSSTTAKNFTSLRPLDAANFSSVHSTPATPTTSKPSTDLLLMTESAVCGALVVVLIVMVVLVYRKCSSAKKAQSRRRGKTSQSRYPRSEFEEVAIHQTIRIPRQHAWSHAEHNDTLLY